MKLRTILLSATSLLLVALLFYACQKQLQPSKPISGQNSLTVSEAQNWFTAKSQNLLALDNARKGTPGDALLQGKFTPWWKQAKQWVLSDNKQILEIPVLTPHQLSVRIKTNNLSDNTQSDKKRFHPTQSFARLIMAKDSSGHIHAAIMEIIGLDTYLKKKNYDLEQNNFLKTDSSFSGIVIFKKFPSGKFMWGYRYVDGVKTGRISFHSSKGQTQHERTSASCSFPVIQTEEFCVTYEGEVDCFTTTEVVGEIDYECDGDGGGGGGNGGYIPPPEPLHGGGGGSGSTIPVDYPQGGNDKPTLKPLSEVLLQQELDTNSFGLLPCGTIDHFYQIAEFQPPASVINRLKA